MVPKRMRGTEHRRVNSTTLLKAISTRHFTENFAPDLAFLGSSWEESNVG